MGKKSLIKATTKKKKEDGKTSPKSSKKVAGKTVPQAEPQPPSVEEPVPAVPVQPPDPRELLFRKFHFPQWPQTAVPPPSTAQFTAPDFVAADDPQEAARMRDMLLNRRHTMQEIRLSAQPPEPPIAEARPVEPTIEEEALPIKAIEATPLTETIEETGGAETRTEEVALPAPDAALQPVAAAAAPYKEVPAPKTAPEAGSGTPPLPAYEPPDPVLRYAKFAALGFALLVIVLLAASYVNRTTYFLQSNNGAVDLWAGRFSPTGKVFVATLKGFRAPEPSRAQYRRNELFPAIFTHYLTIADQLATIAATPDFKAIHASLISARSYAVSEEMHSAVDLRLGTLELMTLLYKADVAISAGSGESLATASRILTEAQKIAANQPQIELIKLKQDKISALSSKLHEPQTSGQQPQATGNTAAESQPR